MDWIHCNVCFKQPAYGDSCKLVLTSCGHFYCNTCLKDGETNKCAKCGSDFTTIELSSKMTKDVEVYFQNPIDVVKKLSEIMVFQNNHRLEVNAHFRHANAKYQAAKVQMRKMFDANKALRRRNAELEMYVKYYQSKLEGGNPRTPVQLYGRATSTPLSHRSRMIACTQGQLLQSPAAHSPAGAPPPVTSADNNFQVSTPQRTNKVSFVTPPPVKRSDAGGAYLGGYRTNMPHYSTPPTTPVESQRRSPIPQLYHIPRSSVSPALSQSSTGSYRRTSMPPYLSRHPVFDMIEARARRNVDPNYIDRYNPQCRRSH